MFTFKIKWGFNNITERYITVQAVYVGNSDSQLYNGEGLGQALS